MKNLVVQSLVVQSTGVQNAQPRDFAGTIANLDAWLQTMRQPGGYAGPVAHWWQNRYRYTGPGLDWRYEGILCGYYNLLQKIGHELWSERLNRAAMDLLDGQREDGAYRASRFEINPGTFGTPHEAAATLGLLTALPCLNERERVLHTAKRNLDNLIARLWDEKGQGFNDRKGVPARVPNKLATLAQGFILYAKASGEERYLDYAKAALRDVLTYQVKDGPLKGAVHQYAPGVGRGDGRFFPYYAARCVPPLVLAAKVFGEASYHDAALLILGFLKRTMNEDGSWPQIIYTDGKRADWPRWVAGAADILLAYHELGENLPQLALERLLSAQLASGGFPTAQGFASQINQRHKAGSPDYRDVTPVVGWNDKVLRLLAALLEPGVALPEGKISPIELAISVGKQAGTFVETRDTFRIVTSSGNTIYEWFKTDPWAQVGHAGVDVR